MKTKIKITLLAVVIAAHLYTRSFVAAGFSEKPGCDFWCYWTASKNLNVGDSPYRQGMETGRHFYLYPPLLAEAIRPLACIRDERTAFALWTLLGLSLYTYGICRCGRYRC